MNAILPTTVQRPLAASTVVPSVCCLLLFSLATGQYVGFAIFLTYLVALCIAYAAVSRYRVRADARIPIRATEGDWIAVTIDVESRTWLPKFVAAATIDVVDQNADAQTLPVYLKDPGDTSRLTESTSREEQLEGFILRRGTSRLHRSQILANRGVTSVRHLTLTFADPFGIFTIKRSFRLDSQVLVRVRPSPGGGFLRVTGSSGDMDTQMRVGDSGDMTEFAGTRAYRPGDELRHIHWPTVARTGDLHVREYTQSSAESVVVLLMRAASNTQPYPAAGEFMLKAVAALVIELFNRRIHVCFGSNLHADHALSIGYSQHYLQQFHDDISAVDWKHTASDMSFLGNLEPPGQDAPWVVVFCVDAPDREELAAVSRKLRTTSSRVIVVWLPPDDSTRVNIPSGMHEVVADEDAPASLFSQMAL